MPMQDEKDLREELRRVYVQLDTLGLIFLAAGNISVRWRDGMLISPTGASAERIDADSFVETAFDGTFEGERKPSSEWSMHAAIYRRRPDAQAVVHTHSDHCVAVAATRTALPPFHYMVAAFGGGDVPCTPYLTFGSPELGVAAAEALATRSACLLGNHGMICHGKSLASALAASLRLEILCRQYIAARQAGTVQLLDADEISTALERFKSYASAS